MLASATPSARLAEKLGFQSFWLTEHHFQPEGAEMSPNPLMVQMSVAAHTKRIRLARPPTSSSGTTRCGLPSRSRCSM